MNDYFDQTEQRMRDAIRRRAHLPWYVRVRGISRTRGLVVLIAALVVVTPAVGAATSWFGFAIGKPDRATPSFFSLRRSGQPLSTTSELLSLRVPDPQGGPPWGLRAVRTTGDETCLDLGRVVDGRLGSLGIDGAWHNDHEFHALPAAGRSLTCGPDDDEGHAVANSVYYGGSSSASPFGTNHGPQVAGHRRIIFAGLLGPDVTSITYVKPSGELAQQQTSGDDGAYLLVFPLNGTTCKLYYTRPCRGGSWGGGGVFLAAAGAIRSIRYGDGHVCSVVSTEPVTNRFATFIKRYLPTGWYPWVQDWPEETPALKHAVLRFATTQHLSLAQFMDIERGTSCPPVGYSVPSLKHLTQADVASQVKVRVLTSRKNASVIQLLFTAPEPATYFGHYYDVTYTRPSRCDWGGQLAAGDIRGFRAGEQARGTEALITPCSGVYRGAVAYVQTNWPFEPESEGDSVLRWFEGNSVIVGRFSFRIR